MNVTHYVDRIIDKIYMITSTDAEKAFDIIKNPFLMKTLNRL